MGALKFPRPLAQTKINHTMKSSSKIRPIVKAIRIMVHVQQDGKKFADVFVNGAKEAHITRTKLPISREALRVLHAMNFTKFARKRETIDAYCKRNKIALNIVAAQPYQFTEKKPNGMKILAS